MGEYRLFYYITFGVTVNKKTYVCHPWVIHFNNKFVIAIGIITDGKENLPTLMIHNNLARPEQIKRF